jgi:hypothetical protein
MSDNELPEFEKREKQQVLPLMNTVFRGQLADLIEYEDGHFRAVLRPDVFTLQPGETQPTRSQWSTLKKRLKRHNRRIFVFKEHGAIPCPNAAQSATCYYLDFGFFLD